MESIYPMLAKGHAGFAMLLVGLVGLSFLFSVLTTAIGPTGGVIKVANVFGIGEAAIGGLVALTGLVLIVAGPFPIGTHQYAQQVRGPVARDAEGGGIPCGDG